MSSKKKTSLSKAQWDELCAAYEALREAPPSARPALFASLTRDNPRLRDELSTFLDDEERISNFMEAPLEARAAAVLAPSELSRGDRLGDYEIREVLGKGSFATVYLAREITLDREVALKVSPIFGQEARTIAQFEHDHIVRVLAQVNLPERNLRLIAMQYVPSVTLEDLLTHLTSRANEGLTGRSILRVLEERIPRVPLLTLAQYRERERLGEMSFAEVVIWMGAKLAEALAHAHGQGVLHLDVKPGNILLNHFGRPHLTDFNVSVDSESLRRGVPTNFGGTFDYMPPEQRAVFGSADKSAAVAAVDHRSDIYALGVVLKRFLQLEGKAPPNTREARLLLERATAESPADRFTDAAELAKALEGCLELMNIRRAIPRRSFLARLTGSYPLTTLTLLGAIPQIIAGVVGWSYNSMRIVSALSDRQQELFRLTNLVYNPVSYLILTTGWIWLVMRLRPYLAEPGRFTPGAMAHARRHALRMPLWGILVTTLGWLPGAVLYPLVLHLYGGGLTPTVYGHFLISFGLSYLIALAYSYLLHQFVTLRAIYPRLWLGAHEIQKTADGELKGMVKRLKGFAALTVSIPLWSASMILSVGPDRFDADTYQEFRALVTFLIGAGGGGVWFALSASQELIRAVFSFTGRSEREKAEIN